MMKKRLAAILKGDTFEGDKLDAADRAYLRKWADNCADDPIWEDIVADARTQGRWPSKTIHSTVIWYALEARRIAESVKSGDDPILREKQKQRAELLALAEKADDLAQYFQETEKYSGIAMFFQRFLVLPVQSEQEAVPRVEPPFLRVQQLRELHEREAKLLRQRAARVPKPTTFISREKGKRHVTAFIHLMTDYMDEICGKQHRHAVALLASMACKDQVDDEDVRNTLRPSTRKGRHRWIRALNAKKS
jgi:hypothetical protein